MRFIATILALFASTEAVHLKAAVAADAEYNANDYYCKQVAEVIKKADKNGDGLINKDEFFTFSNGSFTMDQLDNYWDALVKYYESANKNATPDGKL